MAALVSELIICLDTSARGTQSPAYYGYSGPERRLDQSEQRQAGTNMRQNPHLQSLAPLIGDWTTHGTHPMVPGRTLHGRATFGWLEGGAFLVARTHIEDPQFPDGVLIFGTDDSHVNRGRMLYFDVRSVSREFEWTLDGNVWTWSRKDAEFSQRMHLTIAADGRTIESKGEMSKAGGPWEGDLTLTYTRSR